MTNLSILYFAKKDKPFIKEHIGYLKKHFQSVKVHLGHRQDPFPLKRSSKKWDLVVSDLSPWIIPAWVLKNARIAALNFHPGPPEYPGIGCTNFALYDNAKTFGVTCHHMNPKVDSGTIVAVKRFPVYAKDTVWTLTDRCYQALDKLFYSVMNQLRQGRVLSIAKENWTRKPLTRKELNELCLIDPRMTRKEIARRIRATTYPGMPGAYVILGNERFYYDPHHPST